MKNFTLTICLLLLFGLNLRSNPNPDPPQFLISELMFDKDGKWTIELNNLDTRDDSYIFSHDAIDKISIHSLSGSFEIEWPITTDWSCVTFNEKDYPNSMKINPEGDSIYIKAYKDGKDIIDWRYYLINSLVFGKQRYAVVGSAKPGQSIAHVRGTEFYSISTQPTIGTLFKESDLENMYTTFKGVIYDRNGRYPGNFAIMHHNVFGWPSYKDNYYCDIKTNEKAEYTAKVLSTRVIWEYIKNNNYGYYYAFINKIDTIVTPGTVTNMDIHIITDFHNSIEKNKISKEQPIKFYPNPIGEERLLTYETILPVNTMDTELEIYSLTGQLLSKKLLTEPNGQIELRDYVKGTYIVNVLTNGKKQYSTKITLE